MNCVTRHLHACSVFLDHRIQGIKETDTCPPPSHPNSSLRRILSIAQMAVRAPSPGSERRKENDGAEKIQKHFTTEDAFSKSEGAALLRRRRPLAPGSGAE